jgi:nucleoside-diphosphate-sugar epimerase
MKIVITGALGHIGSHLIRTLVPGEFTEVVLVDNLRTQRFASLFHLPAGVPFRFVEADVLTADLEAVFSKAHAVIHLAAVTESSESHLLLEEIERINGRGTARVAQACAKAGARLLFPSTTSVYGTKHLTVDEACGNEDLRPATPYAVGKLEAEGALAQCAVEEGLKYTVLRLGTIFGPSPGMRFHTAVNRFAWQASVGEPLTVWSTALDQLRPYLDVKDAAAAFLFVLRRDLFGGETFNVLTLNTTVASVVTLLLAEIPELSVTRVDSAAMSPFSYRVSDAKIREAGFVPKGSLERGIRDTLAWLGNLRT